MATTDTAAGMIRRSLEDQDLTVAWLARRTGLPYKRVLRQIKHESRPLELTTAIASAHVLGIDFVGLAEHAHHMEDAAA